MQRLLLLKKKKVIFSLEVYANYSLYIINRINKKKDKNTKNNIMKNKQNTKLWLVANM